MSGPFTVTCVVGARPNFIKIAPLMTELTRVPGEFRTLLVHTGQHYDDRLSRVFFDELDIPRPSVNLEVGSGTHAQQTAAIMAAFEPTLVAERPDLLVVVGDVNSTLACALVAAKLGVPVAHVEAGLRSFDRTMPEEINRVLTDRISDLLFTTEASADANLLGEGIAAERIHFTGNVMIDTLLRHRQRAAALDVPGGFGGPRRYGVLTLHRPATVDDPDVFAGVVEALDTVTRDLPLVFPVHPRTRTVLARNPVATRLADEGRLRVVDPLGYLEFIGLVDGARVVLTDSGGIQEETTILGVPCVTLRTSTERPVTITDGTNRLVGMDPARIVDGCRQALNGAIAARVPPLWDGQAARRIVDVIRGVAAGTRPATRAL